MENIINVFDPDTQEVGSIRAGQLNEALQQGYEQATPQQTQTFINQQKFGGLGQQIITGLEGAGSAATLGLSTGLERALGVNPEDIVGRRETNPWWHGGGQGLGLVAGSLLLPGEGAAGILSKAGETATEAVGLAAPTTFAAKVGSGAVKAAAENALFQTGDEVSKMLSSNHSDPGEAVETAMTNIGLSALLGGGLGGGIGAVSPLWDAASGSKVGEFLNSIVKKSAGIEGEIPHVLANEISQSGLNVAPEIRAGISGQPILEQAYQTLKESSAPAGLKAQEAFSNFRKDAANSALESFGKTADQVVSRSEISDYNVGKNIGDTLHKEMESKSGPLAEAFEGFRDKYKNVELPKGEDVPAVPAQRNVYGELVSKEIPASKLPGFTDQLGDRILGLAEQEGWLTAPSSEIMSQVNKVLKDLPHQKTLNDLKNFIQQVGANTFDPLSPQLTRAGSLMKSVLRDAESDLILQKLGQEGPEIVSQYRATQSAWKSASQLKDALNERLHVGGGDSVGSFLKNLKEMSATDGEKLLRRLSGKGDANLLELLQKEFPGTANALKEAHLNDLLGRAADKASPGEAINVKELSKAIDKMSPEMRSFVVNQKSADSIKAIESVMEAASRKMNSSGTAKTLDSLWSNIPATAAGMVSLVMSHNPAIALAVGALTKYLGRDVPDAARLALLKFFGSSQPVEAGAFKAMVDFIQNTIHGENLIGKSTKAVFKAGQEVIPSKLLPTEKERNKLETRLKDLQKDGSPLFHTGGKIPHYLPDHGASMGKLAATSVNYLNSLRPVPAKQSPLDTEQKVSPEQKANYDRALNVAEQPLLVLAHVKDGTVLPSDIMHLKNIYPSLYNKLSTQLTHELMEAVHKDVQIPYKTRMGVSLFLGQPMDSTMIPQNIMAAQPQVQAAQPPQMGAPKGNHSLKTLGKMSPMYATGQQTREANRAMK